jgi:aspartyl-tRNA(Asn)/glutamyl-tRNA(Gln) amidotransferase subunit B
VERALLFEISRQQNMRRRGVKVVQETRHYDDERNCTVTLRTKEQAEEYRYYPEPDLVPLSIRGWEPRIRASLPELPDARRERFKEQYGISDNHARVVTAEIRLANYYESVAKECEPRLAATWVADCLKGELNYRDMDIKDAFPPESMTFKLERLEAGVITDRGAVEVIRALLKGEASDPKDIILAKDLAKVEMSIIKDAVSEVYAENTPAIIDYRSGKMQALNFLVGKVMEKTRGRADPTEVNRLLRELLECT